MACMDESAAEARGQLELGVAIENVVSPVAEIDFFYCVAALDQRGTQRASLQERRVKRGGERACGLIAHGPVGSEIIGDTAGQERLGEAEAA